MPRFHYQALNAEQELTIGEVEADAVALAIAQLEASGLQVLSIGFATAETTAALLAKNSLCRRLNANLRSSTRLKTRPSYDRISHGRWNAPGR